MDGELWLSGMMVGGGEGGSGDVGCSGVVGEARWSVRRDWLCGECCGERGRLMDPKRWKGSECSVDAGEKRRNGSESSLGEARWLVQRDCPPVLMELWTEMVGESCDC